MAKLFGFPINVEEDGGGGSSIPREFSRSHNQQYGEATSFSAGLPPVNQIETHQYFRFLDSNSDSGSVSMESDPHLNHCFIDFFDRESYVSSNQRLITSRDFNLRGFQDMEEEIELGLRIGSGSGSRSDDSGDLGLQVMEIDSSRVEIDSSRVEIDTGRVEVESGLVEVGPGRVEIEIGPTLAEVEANYLSLEDLSWLVEPMDYHNQEEEPMDQDWDLGFFDALFEDLFDFSLPSLDEHAENHGDYEEVLARTFVESVVNGSPPASKRVVDELPDVGIISEELSIGCAICKDEIVVEEKVKRLPCKHYYHGECIVPWLGIRNTCPVCRYELPTDDVEYERNRRSQRALARESMFE